MKQKVCLFLGSLVLGFGAGMTAACTQDVPGEVLKNPDFNEEAPGTGLPAHWTTSAKQAKWREKAFMGKDYEIVSAPGAYVLATQEMRLKPGQRYTITLTLKGEGGALGGALIVHGKDKPRREMPILWSLQPTAQYEQYVGTFTAPDPVARLYIYNVAKKGTICYDHVSLREGEPTRPIIAQLHFPEISQPIGPPAQTPHMDWASPLAGGAVKTFLAIRNFRCLRQAVELAQRMDLDYDVVSTGEGNECVSETGRRAMKRLDSAYYEVYVVSSRVSEVMAKTIRERVEAGAGLVIVEGFGQASKFVKLSDLTPVDDAHCLRAGIPWDLMPEKILSSVATGALGKGRVVRLAFPKEVARVWGLMPTESPLVSYYSRRFEYWEWWHSLMAKAILWAARGEGSAALRPAAAGPEGIQIKAEGAPAGAKARVIVRSGREIRFDGPLLRTPPKELAVAGDGLVSIVVPPEFPAGPVIADVTLLNGKGEAVTWGSFACATPQSARIADLKSEKDWYPPDADARLIMRLSSTQKANVAVEGALIDAFGRVTAVSSQAVSLEPGETEYRLTLPIRRPISVLQRAFVRLLDSGREQDSAWVSVWAPEVGPRKAAEDFLAEPWSPGMSPPTELAAYAAFEKEIGLNGEFGSTPALIAEHGMPGGGYISPPGGTFRCSERTRDGVRPQCLSNPAVIESYTTKARETAAGQTPFGFFAVGITDEAFLASRHERDELCFCEHCQKRYREQLRKDYGTLEALNREWDTAYRSWDEIKGARTEDVRGKENFAPFVDFRTFMTDVWVDACRTITQAYHQVSPRMPVGHTNTFGAQPFDGMDYWKLCTKVGFGWGQEYSEAIKGSGQKAIFDLWRSFVETPESRRARALDGNPASARTFFNYGWVGYAHSVPAAHYEPWWLALHGSRGVSYFATNAVDAARGTSWALVYPTLSLTAYGKAVQEALRDLRGGCGKVFMEYEREQPKAAILWSYSSMLVSWCESTTDDCEPNEGPNADSFGTWYKSALNFRQHLNELQLDYIYLAPDQITGSDALRQYPVMFLPFTVAASGPLIEKLEAYVAGGGVLIGDLRCLRTDEHGRPFADSGPLKRLFGVERGGKVVYGPSVVKFTASAEGIALGGQQVEVCGREGVTAAGATPLAAHASGEPAVLVRRQGQGLSVYLNFCLPEYDAVTRDLVRQIVEKAGIRRTVVAEDPKGGPPPRCYERNTFRRGPIAVHAFIRDHRRCKDSDPVRFALGEAAHVYDVRAGKYLGKTATVETTVAPGETALYACLPYKVTAVSVSAPPQVKQGEALALHAIVQGDGAKVGDHVLHVELVAPQGRAVWHYTWNMLAPGGGLDMSVPLALNETPGQWKAKVRDVLTGTSAETTFTVVAR